MNRPGPQVRRNTSLMVGRAECVAEVCATRGGLCGLFDAVAQSARPGADRLVLGPQAILYREGEAGRYVYVVRQGVLRLVQHLPNGAARIVRLLRPDDVGGLETLVGGVYRHTASALKEARVCRISSHDLGEMAEREPVLYRNLMRQWQHSVEQAEFALTYLSTGTAEARVARLLLHSPEAGIDSLCFALPRDDMSALLGLTRETVSRVIAQFRRDGLVREDGERCTCDVARLRHIAEAID